MTVYKLCWNEIEDNGDFASVLHNNGMAATILKSLQLVFIHLCLLIQAAQSERPSGMGNLDKAQMGIIPANTQLQTTLSVNHGGEGNPVSIKSLINQSRTLQLDVYYKAIETELANPWSWSLKGHSALITRGTSCYSNVMLFWTENYEVKPQKSMMTLMFQPLKLQVKFWQVVLCFKIHHKVIISVYL